MEGKKASIRLELAKLAVGIPAFLAAIVSVMAFPINPLDTASFIGIILVVPLAFGGAAWLITQRVRHIFNGWLGEKWGGLWTALVGFFVLLGLVQLYLIAESISTTIRGY